MIQTIRAGSISQWRRQQLSGTLGTCPGRETAATVVQPSLRLLASRL